MTNPPSKPLKSSKLQIACFGDVHTGHPKTPTTHILRNLRIAFPDSPRTGDLDIIFIEGDFFDRLLNFNDPNVHEIKYWIAEFLRMCKARDILVRVLEGTPSHDWRQPRHFITINETSNIGADVKYIDELCIEHIDRFDIDVLYIPDEWRVTCDETWKDVVKELARKGLSQVDYAVMHGTFPHQMPKNLHHQLDMHDPNRYLSIVRKYIFVGHIHFHSIWDRIIGAGSFDRTAHGEEMPKGHVRVTVQDGCDDVVEFIENKHAMRYITIDCTGILAEDLNALVSKAVEDLPPDSHVRLKAMRGEAAMAAKDHFEERYPLLFWTIAETGKGVENQTPVLVDTRQLHKTINITKENVTDLLIDRIYKKHPDKNMTPFVQALGDCLDV